MSSPVKFIDNRQYHKSNYSDAVKFVIPPMYFEEDYSLKDNQIDILDKVINSHLNVIKNVSSLINVSAIQGTIYSSINKPAGISKFFVKQNNLTNISLNDFETKILIPLDKSFRDFNSSSDFSDYLTETLLPGIRLNSPTLDFVGDSSPSSNHNYLISNLSWLYFLNLSGPPTLSYNPSAYVHDILISKTYASNQVTLNDGIKGLVTYLWKNYSTQTSWQGMGLIPDDFRPTPFVTENTWTSDEQQLEKLKTLVDVVYSPLYIDDGDLRVKNAIDDYLQNSYYLTKKYPQGPFIKLIKAFSFAFADYSNQIDRLEVLNDIDNCPEEYLPHLADLIGWKLFGSDPNRWRLQIANALDIYKMVGTKKSIQFIADSIFGKDVFNASSTISELWESYVPHLIYYALATESTLLKDFTTWTRSIANDLQCDFSPSSIDENIRMCVDRINYDLVLEFNSQFLLGSKPFPLNQRDFIFNYRGRDYKVPPFEEIPYYVDVIITEELLTAIQDKLYCFGVPATFAEQVVNYIRQRTILATEDYAIRNSWLIFTSSIEYPPNWDTVIQDISNNKVEYLDLWNGKSSHFKVLVDASSFDFTKNSLDTDSKEILKILGQTIKDFSPAKTYPDLIARIATEDYYSASNVTLPLVTINKVDYPQIKYTSAASFAGFGLSALAMSTYKRGLTSNSVATFNRGDVDSIQDSLMAPGGTIAKLARRNHRRRNYKFTLPRDGFYDRTGFNMPAPLSNYQTTSKFLPLGLIPSSQTYVSIPDYKNIPAIYARCENLSSMNVYSGLAVSNTFPVRGWKALGSNQKLGTSSDYYLDRGQLHPFMYAIHYIKEQAKILEASSYYKTNQSDYILDYAWKNVLYSYANSATELSNGFPSSYEDYINFGLGREFHKLYNDYTHNFARHKAVPTVMNLDGPTIFGHALGSVIYNSKLNINGYLANQNTDLISSSLNNIFDFTNGSGIFSNDGVISGTYLAVSSSQWPVEFNEYRNSAILSHVELCQTSGSSQRNSFSVVRLNKSNKTGSRYNPVFHENTVIRQNSVDGFGRIIFDISKYQTDSNLGYDIPYNFLTPDHKFKLSFKSLISDDSGRNFGGDSVGVWIHTKPENGVMWTYTNNKEWIKHDSSGLTISNVILNYCHLFGSDQYARDLTSSSIRCRRFIDPANSNKKNDLLASLSEDDFNHIELEFNTENLPISVPSDYFDNISSQVHRLNQNYIIEVFSNCRRDDRFTLFYDFNLIDQTLNKWSKPLITTNACEEFRVELSREQLLSIIRYLNELTGTYNNFGYASRVANYTSGVYEASGGSRINYVESPDWSPRTIVIGNLLTSGVFTN